MLQSKLGCSVFVLLFCNMVAQETDTPSVFPSQSVNVSSTFMPSHLLFSNTPSIYPSETPSISPSDGPIALPSNTPSINPSNTPSVIPSSKPTSSPSDNPSVSKYPSKSPSETSMPSCSPSSDPSTSPSTGTSMDPSMVPSTSPSSSGKTKKSKKSNKSNYSSKSYKSYCNSKSKKDKHSKNVYVIDSPPSKMPSPSIPSNDDITIIETSSRDKKNTARIDGLKDASTSSSESTIQLDASMILTFAFIVLNLFL